ncbi:MAG: carbohydrate ABC transporter permease [Prevotella sp.]|jgi:putative aldouronate transport system permease protein|nr:carbohydrate ABC transporter permease [Prevotella sp.]
MKYASRKAQENLFQGLIHSVFIILSLAAILPFILLIASSLTEEKSLLVNGYSFLPKPWSLFAYEWIFKTNGYNVFRAYGITVFITVIGTTLSLLVAPMLAYTISRKDYAFRRIVSFFVFFTMIFNGGLVAFYITWTRLLHVKDTIFSLIFPALLFNGFQVMLMKSYFSMNIHPSLIESAKIDGAGEFKIYFNIVLPLSLPIMATVGLMVGINYWNDWMNGLYFLTDPKLFSLQNLLNRTLENVKYLATVSNVVTDATELPSVGVRMAMAVIGALPVMVLYPFFQKYFIKGITLGGIKE